MGKQKIGKDVTSGKDAILSGKDAEDFERWQAEQLAKAEEKEEKPKRQVELKSKMPEEPEPTADQYARELAKEYEEMAKWRAKRTSQKEVKEHE